jgi:hypothetical protein
MGLLARRKESADKGNSSVLERLFGDPRWIAEYRITPEELESLSTVAMMGELKNENDVLFVLNQIRRARLRV